MRYFGSDMHAGYPPLISSTVAVTWWISGNQVDLSGLIVIAVVNACAAVTAAWAVIEFGSSMSAQLRTHNSAGSPSESLGSSIWINLPVLASIGVAVLLIFVFFGVTEPFTTNGYADPLWSVAAVGAVVYALQLGHDRAWLGSAAILLAVAGETKVEGTATVVGIVALICLRTYLRERRVRLRFTVLAIAGIVLLGAWPILMRLRHVGADMNTSGPRMSPIWQRTNAVYNALLPHLHVIALAAILSVVASYALKPVRRAFAIETNLWAWSAVIVGLVAVATAYIFGPGGLTYLDGWLQTSVHRVAEFPALMSWWIVASLVVVAATALAVSAREPPPVKTVLIGAKPLDH
jgi:hypothetical protein